MAKLKIRCIVNLEHVFHLTIQEGDIISPSRNIFAVDISGVGGSRSTDPKDIEKEVKAVFEASLGKEEAELVTRGITQVAAETTNPVSQNVSGSQSTTPPANQPTVQTTPPPITNSTQSSDPKQLRDKGISSVSVDFGGPKPTTMLDPVWERNKRELAKRSITPVTMSTVEPRKKTEHDPLAELQGKGIMPVTAAFDYAPSEAKLKHDAEKARLKKEAEEEQAKLMDPWNQYFQVTSLPDNPIAQYVYYLQQLARSPKQVAYEQYVADELNAENQAIQTEIRDWARENGAGASVVSLLASPLKGVDYLNGVMETAVSGHKRPSSVPSFTETTNVIRDAVGESIAEEYGEGARFVYNTVMSGADTVIAGLTGNISGAIILGTGTASDTANDIIERGGTEEEALIGGAVSGILEGVFEKISLGQLEAMKALPADTVKNILGNITKSVATNAGEEFSTELANTIFDTIFMGELSTYGRITLRKCCSFKP